MTDNEIRIAIAEGVKFGRLTAMQLSHYTKNRMAVWLWRCDCGVLKRIIGASVRSGHTVSCGCLRRETTARTKTVHGNARRKSHTAEYRCWMGMMSRCYNKSNPAYNNYGGRGIKVCPRWSYFNDFLSDMGRKPSSSHSIDRINNELGYSKENCRWATPKEQSNNRRVRRWKKKP